MGIDAAGGGRGRQIAPCIMQSLTLVNNCRESEGAGGGAGKASPESVLGTQSFPHSACPVCPPQPHQCRFTSPTFQARAALMINNSVRAEILA